MLGSVFRVSSLVYLLDGFLVNELHQLEQLLTVLEFHLIYYYMRTCEVAQNSPLFSHLADAHTFVRRVRLNGVILWIVLLYEWCDAVEIHSISDFNGTLTALYQLFLIVKLHLVNAEYPYVVVIKDGPVCAH